jgi:CRP/FNR family transcriptional regulator, anaerobic regulatory protein
MQSTVHPFKPAQSNLWATLKEVRSLLQLPTVELEATGELFARRKVKTGASVYRLGQQFEYVYVVSNGFLKNVVIDESGTEQILGFPMRGDLLGFDGINEDRHESEAIALTDVEVIAIPLNKLSEFTHDEPALANWVYRIISRELVREQVTVGMLGMLGAEARVARFLYNLGQRYQAMGFSSRNFVLKMTRQEIGCYLGLTIETVSRSMSALHGAGFIKINQREVEILEVESLRTLQRISQSTAGKHAIA